MTDQPVVPEDFQYYNCAGCMTVYGLPAAIIAAGFTCPNCRGREIGTILKDIVAKQPKPLAAPGPLTQVDWQAGLVARGFTVADNGVLHKRYRDGDEVMLVWGPEKGRGFLLKRPGGSQGQETAPLGDRPDLQALLPPEALEDLKLAFQGRQGLRG